MRKAIKAPTLFWAQGKLLLGSMEITLTLSQSPKSSQPVFWGVVVDRHPENMDMRWILADSGIAV